MFYLDILIQKISIWIMKINDFRGELTDISAKKEALVVFLEIAYHLQCLFI